MTDEQNPEDEVRVAKSVRITQDSVEIDGEPIPWWVSENITVRTVVQTEPGERGLHLVTLEIYADTVEIVAPLKNPVEHIVEVTTVTVNTASGGAENDG